LGRVFVIIDDGLDRIAVRDALTGVGYSVEVAPSLEATLPRAAPADVLVLDLGNVSEHGIALCRALHEGDRTARLLVLGRDASERVRIAAFEAGADDFLAKPFSLRELVLRVRALERRGAPRRIDALTIGPLLIQRGTRRVTVCGDEVDLSRREFDLLLQLVEEPGRVQTRDALSLRAWGRNVGANQIVDTAIKRLRKKLGERVPIETVRGVGYRIG
jgi:two-component system phosphate regulon response regulator PhoB